MSRRSHGVRFHSNADFTPTRDFNADDVLFSFERQWRPDHPYARVSGRAYESFEDLGMGTLLRAIDRLDDDTVRFTLTRPDAPFLDDLTASFGSILSAEYGAVLLKRGTPEKMDQQPIGTGPFRFVSYEKDTEIRFAAFDDYWGGRPKLDALVFAITPDASVRHGKLSVGQCHIIPYPNPAELPAMARDRTIAIMRQQGLNLGFLAFNVARKPFDDVRVRQAISLAIDRRAILDQAYNGSAMAAKSLIPPGMWAYGGAIEDYPYDPKQARALLAEAGLAHGFTTDLWTMPVPRAYAPNPRLIAALIQGDLAKINVTVKLVTTDWTDYRRRIQNGEHQMALFGSFADNADPDNFLKPILGCAAARPGGGNVSKWCNPEFEALLAEAQGIRDPAIRTGLYLRAQMVAKREAPLLPLAHALLFDVRRKEVQGYLTSPLNDHDFRDVSLGAVQVSE